MLKDFFFKVSKFQVELKIRKLFLYFVHNNCTKFISLQMSCSTFSHCFYIYTYMYILVILFHLVPAISLHLLAISCKNKMQPTTDERFIARGLHFNAFVAFVVLTILTRPFGHAVVILFNTNLDTMFILLVHSGTGEI